MTIETYLYLVANTKNHPARDAVGARLMAFHKTLDGGHLLDALSVCMRLNPLILECLDLILSAEQEEVADVFSTKDVTEPLATAYMYYLDINPNLLN